MGPRQMAPLQYPQSSPPVAAHRPQVSWHPMQEAVSSPLCTIFPVGVRVGLLLSLFHHIGIESPYWDLPLSSGEWS